MGRLWQIDGCSQTVAAAIGRSVELREIETFLASHGPLLPSPCPSSGRLLIRAATLLKQRRGPLRLHPQ